MSTALSESQNVSRISVANALSRVTGVTNGAVLAAVADQMFFDIHRNPQQWQAGLGDAQVLAYVQNYGSAELKREMQERSYGKSEDTPNAAFRSAALLAGTLAPWQQYAGLRGMGGTGMNGTEQGTGSGSSGARYDGVNNANYSPGSPAYWASAQGMSEMRSYAMQQGLGWAAGVPEILRMGPEAVKALADVHLQKKSYDTLRKDAAFAPKDVVTLAKFAKKEKIDANKLSHTIGDFYRGLQPSEKNELNKAIIPRMEHPDSEEHKVKAAKAIDDMVRKHPHKKQKGEELKRQLKLRTEELDMRKKASGAAWNEADKKKHAEAGAQQVAQNEQQAARDDQQKANQQVAALDDKLGGAFGDKPESPAALPQGTKAADNGPAKPKDENVKVADASPANKYTPEGPADKGSHKGTDKGKDAAGKPDDSKPKADEPKKPETRQASLARKDAPKVG